MPVCSVLMRRLPEPLTVAVYTVSPTFFITGTLSPVSMDSSTSEPPSMTVPSTGMLSPALTRTVSPTATSEAGILTSFPSRMTEASCGSLLRSSLTASLVLTLPMASRYFPMETKAMIMAAESKARCIM